MKIVIIEDEAPAARRLERMIPDSIKGGEVIATLGSVQDARLWFRDQPPPDLILADIQLADGLSFEIFELSEIKCPVIFITAFDEYAIQAFKMNSIGYLLKPVKSEDLMQAVAKFKQTAAPSMDMIARLLQDMGVKPKSYTTRLMIKFGATMKVVHVDEIAYFYSENKTTHLRNHEGKDYPVDLTLEKLEEQLDPAHFFRINRQFLIHIKAIDRMVNLSRSRIKVVLVPESAEDTIVSSSRSAQFKQWIAT